MKTLLKCLLLIFTLVIASCGPNADRDRQKMLDANNFMKGELKGYASGVYLLDVGNNSYNRIDGETLEYKVYLNDGEYTIDFDGDTYVLSKIENPIDLFGNGVILLKWKFGNGYYIEDIPHSY